VPEGTGREATSAAYRQFNLWFVAMLLTGLAGVLIFWGCFRFAFVLEPVLIPFAAMGVGWVCRRGAESPIADRCYKDEDGLKGM
jgi:hypothetical protein